MKLATLTNPNFKPSIQKLLKEPLPLKTAFKLKGIAKRAQEELDKYEEVRGQAIEKYGTRDDNGNLVSNEDGGIKMTDENLKKFIVEINDLLQLEIDIGTVNIDELGNNLNVTAEELIALDGIIV